MLQKEYHINYADLRTNKSEVGELFIVQTDKIIVQTDKRRMDNVVRLQPINVEVEAVEEENFDADRFINTSVSIFTIFSIIAVVFGCFYLYPITSIIFVLIGSFTALLINRVIRLHDIRVNKKR